MKESLLILLGLLLLMSGCQSKSSKDNSDITLFDTNWTLISYGYQNDEESKVLINYASYSVVFESSSNSVKGTIDCNSFESTFSIVGENITVDDVLPTEITCSRSGEIYFEDQVNTVVNAFRTISFYTLSESKLTLTTFDSMELVFEPTFEGCSDPVPITSVLSEYPSLYLVTFEDGVDTENYVNELQSQYDDLEVSHIFTSFPGFSAESSDQTLKKIQCDSNVESIAFDVPEAVNIQ